MYKVASILILFLIGGTLAVEGQEWLSPWTYDQDAGSYFTDPLFYPWTSQAEKDLYQSQYYREFRLTYRSKYLNTINTIYYYEFFYELWPPSGIFSIG